MQATEIRKALAQIVGEQHVTDEKFILSAYTQDFETYPPSEIDFIWIGEDIAFNTGTYVRPEVFREFVMPYFRRMAANIKKPWIYHSDGNILPVLDDLLTLGMNAVHPLQPGAMDIRQVKQTHGSKVALIGSVDLNTLTLGTEEDVTHEVNGLMDDCSPGGRYLLSSSNSLACYLKTQNIAAMGAAKRAWNRKHGFDM